MYLIRRHRGNAFRQAAIAQLTQAQRDQFTSFVNKATGWFTVALGAALLAVDQTWQVIDRHHWPVWLFWLLIIVMAGVSVLNTAARMSHDARTATSIEGDGAVAGG
jgi:cell division protein FtsW (lipid II flippase)